MLKFASFIKCTPPGGGNVEDAVHLIAHAGSNTGEFPREDASFPSDCEKPNDLPPCTQSVNKCFDDFADLDTNCDCMAGDNKVHQMETTRRR